MEGKPLWPIPPGRETGSNGEMRMEGPSSQLPGGQAQLWSLALISRLGTWAKGTPASVYSSSLS